MARMTSEKCAAPPSGRSSRVTEVTTTCLSPSLWAASATRSGSSGSTVSGHPLVTLQKRQFLVHTPPKTIKVAVRLRKHSPQLGQSADSQTVCSERLRSSAMTSSFSLPVLALTLSHSGFLSGIFLSMRYSPLSIRDGRGRAV